MGEWPMPNPPPYPGDDEGLARVFDTFDSGESIPLEGRRLWSVSLGTIETLTIADAPLDLEWMHENGEYAMRVIAGVTEWWEKIDGEWRKQATTMPESYETDVGIPTERGAMSDDPQEPLKFPIPTLASIRRQLREEFGKPPCPGGHTPEPDLYLPQAAWAEEMLETHVQMRCPDCGLWAIWVPKKGVSVEDANSARRRLARKYGVSRGRR